MSTYGGYNYSGDGEWRVPSGPIFCSDVPVCRELRPCLPALRGVPVWRCEWRVQTCESCPHCNSLRECPSLSPKHLAKAIKEDMHLGCFPILTQGCRAAKQSGQDQLGHLGFMKVRKWWRSQGAWLINWPYLQVASLFPNDRSLNLQCCV